MTVFDAALPTLVVALSWLGIAVVLAGCGVLARCVLVGHWPGSRPQRLAFSDLWLGLAVLVVYLQAWNLAFSITWVTWVPAVALGVPAVTVAAIGRLRRATRKRPPLAVIALVAVGALWLANQALAVAGDYDLGLYHLGVIEYASKYATIPGLGNLQIRLGSSNGHLLFVSLLDRGPWAGAGLHLANGLLAAMLFAEIGSRFTRPAMAGRAQAFTRRLALLLIPATVVLVGIAPRQRLASPNLDFAIFVLVAVGMLYLAECVESDFPPGAVLTATAMLALASTTRPLYWVVTAIALGLVVVGLGHRHAWRRQTLVTACLACVLPIGLLVGWSVRQAILTGYPFFPTPFFPLPVDWRVPASAVHNYNELIGAWARWPALPPSQVLGSWHWLTAWWLHARFRDPDVIAPLALLACVVPPFVGRGAKDSERAKHLAPMLVVVLPSAGVLIAWFFTAPDPRFVFAPIWLVPAALVAWALPSVTRFWPDDVDRLIRVLPHVCVVAAMLGAVGFVTGKGALIPVNANGTGPLGTDPEPTPKVKGFETTSGLHLLTPTNGADRCWHAYLCTPYPNRALRLRGLTVADGFSVK